MDVREGVMKLVGVRGKEADDEMDAKKERWIKAENHRALLLSFVTIFIRLNGNQHQKSLPHRSRRPFHNRGVMTKTQFKVAVYILQ